MRLRGKRVPLLADGTVDSGWLVGLRLHVLRQRLWPLVWHPGSLRVLEMLQALLDVGVAWIQIIGALISVQRVTCLIVAGFVLRNK